MCVVHTTSCEVYNRMWAIHEVDESLLLNVQMRGIFDEFAWTEEQFEKSTVVKCEKGECQEKDRIMLTEKILSRGGFARLDAAIAAFRIEMQSQLHELIKTESTKEHEVFEDGRIHDRYTKSKGEWTRKVVDYTVESVESNENWPPRVDLRWKHSDKWEKAMKKVALKFRTSETQVFLPAGFFPGNTFYPQGTHSFELGRPGSSFLFAPRKNFGMRLETTLWRWDAVRYD